MNIYRIHRQQHPGTQAAVEATLTLALTSTLARIALGSFSARWNAQLLLAGTVAAFRLTSPNEAPTPLHRHLQDLEGQHGRNIPPEAIAPYQEEAAALSQAERHALRQQLHFQTAAELWKPLAGKYGFHGRVPSALELDIDTLQSNANFPKPWISYLNVSREVREAALQLPYLSSEALITLYRKTEQNPDQRRQVLVRVDRMRRERGVEEFDFAVANCDLDPMHVLVEAGANDAAFVDPILQRNLANQAVKSYEISGIVMAGPARWVKTLAVRVEQQHDERLPTAMVNRWKRAMVEGETIDLTLQEAQTLSKWIHECRADSSYTFVGAFCALFKAPHLVGSEENFHAIVAPLGPNDVKLLEKALEVGNREAQALLLKHLQQGHGLLSLVEADHYTVTPIGVHMWVTYGQAFTQALPLDELLYLSMQRLTRTLQNLYMAELHNASLDLSVAAANEASSRLETLPAFAGRRNALYEAQGLLYTYHQSFMQLLPVRGTYDIEANFGFSDGVDNTPCADRAYLLNALIEGSGLRMGYKAVLQRLTVISRHRFKGNHLTGDKVPAPFIQEMIPAEFIRSIDNVADNAWFLARCAVGFCKEVHPPAHSLIKAVHAHPTCYGTITARLFCGRASGGSDSPVILKARSTEPLIQLFSQLNFKRYPETGRQFILAFVSEFTSLLTLKIIEEAGESSYRTDEWDLWKAICESDAQGFFSPEIEPHICGAQAFTQFHLTRTVLPATGEQFAYKTIKLFYDRLAFELERPLPVDRHRPPPPHYTINANATGCGSFDALPDDLLRMIGCALIPSHLDDLHKLRRSCRRLYKVLSYEKMMCWPLAAWSKGLQPTADLRPLSGREIVWIGRMQRNFRLHIEGPPPDHPDPNNLRPRYEAWNKVVNRCLFLALDPPASIRRREDPESAGDAFLALLPAKLSRQLAEEHLSGQLTPQLFVEGHLNSSTVGDIFVATFLTDGVLRQRANDWTVPICRAIQEQTGRAPHLPEQLRAIQSIKISDSSDHVQAAYRHLAQQPEES